MMSSVSKNAKERERVRKKRNSLKFLEGLCQCSSSNCGNMTEEEILKSTYKYIKKLEEEAKKQSLSCPPLPLSPSED